MAIIIVRTNDGEDVCSWVIENGTEVWWPIEVDDTLPGLQSAVRSALEIEAEYEKRLEEWLKPQ